MNEIKLIKKDTDLTKLIKLNWDSWYNNQPLTVYKLEGFYHSIGGHWGNNDYYACNRNEKPTFDNLMSFCGEICQWGFSIKEKNSYKYKWEEKSIENNVRVEILRNNKLFYTFIVNNFDYGLAKARKLLFEIQEHVICFSEIDYQNQIIGRKIYFDKMPCMIDNYIVGNDRVIIKPDLNYMTMDEWHKNLDEYFEGDEMIPEDLFASSINWFRD